MTEQETIATKKQKLRKEVLARRDALGSWFRTRRSVALSERLSEHVGTPEHKMIAVYAAMKSEISLDPYIRTAYKLTADFCFPCIVKSSDGTSKMSFFQVTERQYKKRKAPFIVNPLRSFTADDPALREFSYVAPQRIDVMVVPAVAFDSLNNRLGYGGGYYDRYLPFLRKDADVVGVIFKEQFIDYLPFEEHDRCIPTVIYS